MWLLIPAAAVVVLALWLAVRAAGGSRRTSDRIRAVEQFGVLHELLEKKFLQTAAASGKPRGLRWMACEFDKEPRFACDRTTGELFALVGATIRFEAIEGGDMEDVEAVGNLRAATAVLIHRAGEWDSDGRVVFNHSPQETLQRFAESLEPYEPTDVHPAGRSS